MSSSVSETAVPISSGEFPAINPRRAQDINDNQQLVAKFLEDNAYDSLLLQKANNIAWFTSGGDCPRGNPTQANASLFLTADARVVLASNVDSGQIFDHELPGLGFQLKERPWHEPREILIEDVCRGRNVASDTGFGRTHDVSVLLTCMRLPLTEFECIRMRELGRTVTQAVEATARSFKRGETEAEIAGHLTHRLIRKNITPERVQVAADGQGKRYRNWTFGEDCVDRSCVLSVIGRREGLCVGVGRTVSFGKPPEELRTMYLQAMLVQATGMFFSQPKWELFETWSRVQRIYEKFGCPEEWHLAEQAEVIGYEVCEAPVVPKSEFRLTKNTPVFWHPSIGPACVGDTVLVLENGHEILTPAVNWPKLRVEVKGKLISRPAILRRKD